MFDDRCGFAQSAERASGNFGLLLEEEFINNSGGYYS
jgi:hypothetical protein